MVRKYNPEKDFDIIKEWGQGWGASYEKDLLPPTGFIVPGICAYFIYETNSKVCWLENLIRNPYKTKEECASGIEECVTETLREVSKKGYKAVYTIADNPVVIDRAIKHGASIDPNHTLISLRFNQPNCNNTGR